MEANKREKTGDFRLVKQEKGPKWDKNKKGGKLGEKISRKRYCIKRGISHSIKRLILTYQNPVKYAESYGEYTLKIEKRIYSGKGIV